MKSQIELLTLQREQLSQSLSRAESEKVPISISQSFKRQRQVDTPTASLDGHQKESASTTESSKPFGTHAMTTSEREASFSGMETVGTGAARAGGQGCYGCVREVDWEIALGGRRRKLVQAALPLDALAALQAESRKRYRARDGGMNGFRDNFFLGKERPKTHKEIAAARAQAAAQLGAQQSPVTDVRGNVTNGGRKLITSSGQKVIIKFTAKNPGISPKIAGVGSSSFGAHKNLRDAARTQGNGSHTPRPALAAEIPINANKKHRTLLGLAESKMQRGVASPRMAPSSHPDTPRDRHKQDWGQYPHVLLLYFCLSRLFTPLAGPFSFVYVATGRVAS